MLKPFNELIEIDIESRLQNKGKDIDFLPWADCLILLYEHGADSVTYGNHYAPSGHSLFLTEGGLPEVHVWVEIDGKRYELTYPIIDGYKSVSMDNIKQLDVHKASQRAMVKCVAINTGLGLKLWTKEEDSIKKESVTGHSTLAVKRRIEEKLTAKLKKYARLEDMYAHMNIDRVNKRSVDTALSACVWLYEFEKELDRL